MATVVAFFFVVGVCGWFVLAKRSFQNASLRIMTFSNEHYGSCVGLADRVGQDNVNRIKDPVTLHRGDLSLDFVTAAVVNDNGPKTCT